MKRLIKLKFLMLAGLIAGCTFYQDRPQAPGPDAKEQPQVQERSLAPFGNISQAADDPDNFLVIGEGSSFSYNTARGAVNWVIWKTTPADLGESIARPDFRPDPRLPAALRRINFGDYSGSGYDRGHMVPAADRFGSPATFNETFLMTNIVPQTPSLNQYPWQQLESYVRSQVRRGWDAYQIAGAYGELQVIKKRLTVPTNCWKIVVLVRTGNSPEIIGSTKIVAVDMPNRDSMENDRWQRYQTTVRTIEVRTGFDLFRYLDPAVQEEIETQRVIMSRSL